MKAVFVTYCHPDTPHICAARARGFAEALTGLGHRIVILTAPLEGGPPPDAPAAVANRLAAHDWATPFVVACPPAAVPLAAHARAPHIAPPLRNLLVAGNFLARGGTFADWRVGAAPYVRVLAEAFAPDAVWGLFGNTDCWLIARDLAHAANCPWVMDLKDHWCGFLPAGLRRLVARRFTAAAAMTAFSAAHAAEAAPFFRQRKTVVYSGLPCEVIHTHAPSDPHTFRVTLAGGVYDPADLGGLIGSVAAWLKTLPPRDRTQVVFAYVGSDRAAVSAAAGALRGLCRVELHDYLPAVDFHDMLLTARVNLYVKCRGGFHHKIFELLSAGRPIVCHPAETDEVAELAHRIGTPLHSCNQCADVAGALAREWDHRHRPLPPTDRRALAAFTWRAQAETLLGVLDEAIAGTRP